MSTPKLTKVGGKKDKIDEDIGSGSGSQSQNINQKRTEEALAKEQEKSKNQEQTGVQGESKNLQAVNAILNNGTIVKNLQSWFVSAMKGTCIKMEELWNDYQGLPPLEKALIVIGMLALIALGGVAIWQFRAHAWPHLKKFVKEKGPELTKTCQSGLNLFLKSDAFKVTEETLKTEATCKTNTAKGHLKSASDTTIKVSLVVFEFLKTIGIVLTEEKPKPESKPAEEKPKPESKPAEEKPKPESKPAEEKPKPESKPAPKK